MLKMKNVTYVYEDKTVALKDISMDFTKGRCIGIIGSNGAGKSTLFLNFTGVLRPESGQIFYNNEPIKYDKNNLRELRKHVSIVFQDPDKQIFFSRVYDDVAFALRNLGVDEEEVKRKVEKALESVGAGEFADKPVHFLSHGQKKRVAIAGVIAMDSDIIFMDEPSAGLDPLSTAQVEEIIKSLSKHQGKKVIVSSHDMDLIYKVCDYVYVIDGGSILAHGNTGDVFMMDEVLSKAGLVQPYLIKLHTRLGYPLFETEEQLYKYKG